MSGTTVALTAVAVVGVGTAGFFAYKHFTSSAASNANRKQAPPPNQPANGGGFNIGSILNDAGSIASSIGNLFGGGGSGGGLFG